MKSLPFAERLGAHRSCARSEASIGIARPVAIFVLWAVATLGVGLTGCRSSHYTASTLPPEYRAVTGGHRETLNLSQLASNGFSNSHVGPGDLVELRISSGAADDEGTETLARVGSNGILEVPIIGPVPAADVDPTTLSEIIAQAAVDRGIFIRPHVTVHLKSKAVNHVTVLGAVEKPGTYEVPRGSSDLAAAIAAAGGLREDASTLVDVLRNGHLSSANRMLGDTSDPGATGDVQPAGYGAASPLQGTRPTPTASSSVTRIDLASAQGESETLSEQEAHRISDRDIVMVLPKEKEVIHVTGLVNQPGQYEISDEQDIRLMDAVALAGGLRSPVADRVLILRRLEDMPPTTIRASLGKAKQTEGENLRIAPGDTISVERTAATVVVDTLSQLFRISVGLTGRTAAF